MGEYPLLKPTAKTIVLLSSALKRGTVNGLAKRRRKPRKKRAKNDTVGLRFGIIVSRHVAESVLEFAKITTINLLILTDTRVICFKIFDSRIKSARRTNDRGSEPNTRTNSIIT